MGKFMIVLVVVFAVLLCLRLYNIAQQKRARRAANAAEAAAPRPELMVRCARCGVYLPRSEALSVDGGLRCRDPSCA